LTAYPLGNLAKTNRIGVNDGTCAETIPAHEKIISSSSRQNLLCFRDVVPAALFVTVCSAVMVAAFFLALWLLPRISEQVF
jgi:hypothetical protein